MTIAANASVSISVNESLQEHAPEILGRQDSYGSVIFRFTSFGSMNLHATAIPSLQGLPVAFHMQARNALGPTDPSSSTGPGSLEGIWWRARTGLQDILVVSNSSDHVVGGTLSLSDAAGKQWSEPIIFAPHQSVRIAVLAMLQKSGLSGNFGGISIEAPSSISALDAVHLMYDEGGKFSASLEMFSRDPNATVRDRTGSDEKLWTIRAPMLALRSPDPALGLPSKTSLQPTILLRNTTGHKISADISLNWHSDFAKGLAKLSALQLAPFATQELQIWEAQKQLGISDGAHWAMVSVTTDAQPDDLITVASSRDCTGEYNVETKFFGGSGGHFASGQWLADGIHNHLAAITNVGAQPADVLLTLHYDNGAKKYELQQTIPPGDQMWLNLNQLIQQHTPDRNGNLLPSGLTSGTYDLKDLAPAGNNLVVNDLAVNTATGQAVPDCLYCCGYDLASVGFVPDSLDVALGFSDPLTIEGGNSCNGLVTTINALFSDWSSSDVNIGTVIGGTVTGVSAGNLIGTAEGTVNGPGQCACSPRIVWPTVSVAVTPTITAISPNWGKVGTSVPVTISGKGFGTAPTVGFAGSGMAVTYGTPLNDSTVSAIFTISSNAPVGFQGITVTNNTTPDGGTAKSSPVNFQVTPATATPVNFRIYSESPLNNGSLFFTYKWSSSTGNQADLSACTVGESVYYPNYPSPSYIWPLPMVSSPPTPNPTVISGPGTYQGSTDTNKPPDSYQTPYGPANFATTQRFWWSCTNYSSGATQTLSPDVTIARKVFKDTDGFWKYQISKSGYTNTVKLPNQ